MVRGVRDEEDEEGGRDIQENHHQHVVRGVRDEEDKEDEEGGRDIQENHHQKSIITS